jgi:hypothetical protein
MQLNLDDTQVTALKLAIDSYYSDLREEIANTDAYNVRQTLMGIEQSLVAVRAMLEPGWTVANTTTSREPMPGRGTPPVGMPGA